MARLLDVTTFVVAFLLLTILTLAMVCSPSTAGEPKWILETETFTLSMGDTPVGEIPDEIPLAIRLRQRQLTREDFLCLLANKGHPTAVMLRDKQDQLTWFGGTLEPTSGDRSEPIVVPDSIRIILMGVDGSESMAQYVVALKTGAWLGLTEPGTTTYEDIYVEQDDACIVFVGFYSEDWIPDEIETLDIRRVP